jgi:metal-responsive CopG/Arc/MetJ family transcriptional regulator
MERFKPVKNEKIVITIRIENYRLEELDKIANKFSISRNELISQSLNFAIKNIDFEEVNKKVN